MGKVKYLKHVLELFESPVVSFSSIAFTVKKFGGSKKYASLLTKKLLEKGKIKKIVRGFYTVYEEPSLLVYCLAPAYLGLQDALSLHNLWEQEKIPIILTCRKVKQGIRKIFNSNVLVRRLDKRYFFGFEYFRVENFYFPVSDLEKTFIDLIHFKQKVPLAIIKTFKKKIDQKTQKLS